METYLAIVITLLIATQIIRVTQNALHLQKYEETDRDNKEVLGMWKRMSRDVTDIKRQLRCNKDDM